MRFLYYAGSFIKFFSLKRPLRSVTELAGIMEINFLCPLPLLSSSSFALYHLLRELGMKNFSVKKLSLSRPFSRLTVAFLFHCRAFICVFFARLPYTSLSVLCPQASFLQSFNPFHFALLAETPSSIPKGDASNAGIM